MLAADGSDRDGDWKHTQRDVEDRESLLREQGSQQRRALRRYAEWDASDGSDECYEETKLEEVEGGGGEKKRGGEAGSADPVGSGA